MPVAPPNVSQIINGVQYDWSSVEINADNAPFGGVKSLSWDHGLEPGEGRGTRAQVTLRSRGKYSANASIEMYASEYQGLITKLGAGGTRGYMEYAFRIDVNYVELNLAQGGLISFTLNGCRIKKESHSGAEGGELIMVKAELHVMSVVPKAIGVNTPLYAVEPTVKFVKP